MKFYLERYSYVGFMPDGTVRRFATEEDYEEAYQYALEDKKSQQNKEVVE